ncbi:hypothetical protein U1Q18_015715, partial [Sarracenia purpurea var. burkii]
MENTEKSLSDFSLRVSHCASVTGPCRSLSRRRVRRRRADRVQPSSSSRSSSSSLSRPSSIIFIVQSSPSFK